jgi:hypothetical protein
MTFPDYAIVLVRPGSGELRAPRAVMSHARRGCATLMRVDPA